MALLGLVLFVAGLCLVPLQETDLFFRLANGQEILRTGRVPAHNLFSFTFPKQPYLDSAWLFDVATAWLLSPGRFSRRGRGQDCNRAGDFRRSLSLAAPARFWPRDCSFAARGGRILHARAPGGTAPCGVFAGRGRGAIPAARLAGRPSQGLAARAGRCLVGQSARGCLCRSCACRSGGIGCAGRRNHHSFARFSTVCVQPCAGRRAVRAGPDGHAGRPGHLSLSRFPRRHLRHPSRGRVSALGVAFGRALW